MLCFHHKKCAKSQFTSKFILTPACDIFKQSNLKDRAILCVVSFTSYKLATKNLHLLTTLLQLVAKGHPEEFFNFKPCQIGELAHWLDVLEVYLYLLFELFFQTFILQLEGKTKWKLFKPMQELPQEASPDLELSDVGEPIHEFDMKVYSKPLLPC